MYKRGGRDKIPAGGGGSKYTTPPPSLLTKKPCGQERGEGWGYILSPWVFFSVATPAEPRGLGGDMGGVQNVWGGGGNVPENALSRKFLDPSKRASGLLCRGFLYRKNRALTPEGGGKRTVGGGVQNPFLGGVSFVRFSNPPPFSTPPPPWRPLSGEKDFFFFLRKCVAVIFFRKVPVKYF